jgi:hypothetical protein
MTNLSIIGLLTKKIIFLQMPAYNPWTSLLEERGAAHRAVAAYDRLTRKGEGTSGGSP